MDVDAKMFSTLCTVHADTSHVLKETRNGPGGLYYELVFKIVLLCGLTELKAQIRWMENGEEKRGPATIVYDDDTEAIT